MNTHRRTAVVDLDGTLAEYDHWRGEDHFGKPILHARDALLELREWGWWIVIFTTRGNADKVCQWLCQHDMPFGSINSCEHNPEGCSTKPIADVYFDDRDAHCVGQKPYNWVKAMRRVRRLYQPALNTYIDDASAWASPVTRFLSWLRGRWSRMADEHKQTQTDHHSTT